MMRQRGAPAFRTRLATLAVTLGAAVLLVACGATAIGQPVVPVPDGDPVVGKALLQQYACVTCHNIPGVTGARTFVGPPLDAWAERRFIAGRLANDPDHLIAWIVNPQAVEPGTAMPTTGASPAEARDMAAYLFTLTD